MSGSKRFESGDPLLAIAGFSLTGLDEISTRTTLDTIRWLIRHRQVRHQANQNGGLAELFARRCRRPTARKAQANDSAMRTPRSDRYVMAVSQVDFGNVRPIWFNPCSDDQPWFTDNANSSHGARQFAKLTSSSESRNSQSDTRSTLDINPLLKLLVSAQIQWHLINRTSKQQTKSRSLTRQRTASTSKTPTSLSKDQTTSSNTWTVHLPKQALVTNEDGTKAK